MKNKIMTENLIQMFERHLVQEEKSSITIEKYMRDVRKFWTFARCQNVTKELVIDYFTKKDILRILVPGLKK